MNDNLKLNDDLNNNYDNELKKLNKNELIDIIKKNIKNYKNIIDLSIYHNNIDLNKQTIINYNDIDTYTIKYTKYNLIMYKLFPIYIIC